jgi:hypothetical protein
LAAFICFFWKLPSKIASWIQRIERCNYLEQGEECWLGISQDYGFKIRA